MIKKLVLAGAMTAIFTAPAFAEWYVLKPAHDGAGSGSPCMVVDRAASPGENQVAGPFATQEEGEAAAAAEMACEAQSDSDSPMENNDPMAPNPG